MTETGSAESEARAADLREAMIGELREYGEVVSDRVGEAFRAVPRHLFTPGAMLQEAYAWRDAVHMKRDSTGVPISTVSSPQLQAGMLEQADIQPGMRCLEIGSGGVNAAMMSWLAGPSGHVTSVDIDRDVTERARALLDDAGFNQVDVVLADAEYGVPERAPFDRIIVTVGAWDIPPAWVEQLAPGGRLVVPLRVRGLTRSLELERDGNDLISRSATFCGFVAMQGDGANQEHLLPLRGDDAVVRFDDGWAGEHDPNLDGVLDTPRAEAWSSVTVRGQEPFDTLQLWLATVCPGFGRLRADSSLRPVLTDDGTMWFDSAVVDGDSVAYLTARRIEAGVSELGAHAFGPRAVELAAAMAAQIGIWDRDHRHASGPVFTVMPVHTPENDSRSGDLVVTKRHRRIAISWPSSTARPGTEETIKGE